MCKPTKEYNMGLGYYSSVVECMPGLMHSLSTVLVERSRFIPSNLGWFSKGMCERLACDPITWKAKPFTKC